MLNASWRRCFLISAGILSIPVVMSLVIVIFAASWLHVENQPVNADAAFVLAGDPSRAFYAADIFGQGYVQHVYVSRAVRLNSYKLLDELGILFPRQEDIYRQVLAKKGVPEMAISLVGNGSVSTVDESLIVKEELSGKVHSLLVVTSPYHVRRTEMIFHDVLPDMQVVVISTPYEEFPDVWWQDQNAARNVLLELAKIAFYQLGGRFHSR